MNFPGDQRNVFNSSAGVKISGVGFLVFGFKFFDFSFFGFRE